MAVQDLLSQDEIDALLHGVDDGLVQTDNASEPGTAPVYPARRFLASCRKTPGKQAGMRAT